MKLLSYVYIFIFLSYVWWFISFFSTVNDKYLHLHFIHLVHVTVLIVTHEIQWWRFLLFTNLRHLPLGYRRSSHWFRIRNSATIKNGFDGRRQIRQQEDPKRILLVAIVVVVVVTSQNIYKCEWESFLLYDCCISFPFEIHLPTDIIGIEPKVLSLSLSLPTLLTSLTMFASDNCNVVGTNKQLSRHFNLFFSSDIIVK